DIFAAAVVALAGIPFRVLVGQLGALRRHDRRAGVVFGSDQLDVLFLAYFFFLDGGPDFGVHLGQGEFAVEHDGEFLERKRRKAGMKEWAVVYRARAVRPAPQRGKSR